MGASSTLPATRVLVVTEHPEPTPGLLDAIRERAALGPATFRVLVPNPEPAELHPLHPNQRDKIAPAADALTHALPAYSEAAGAIVDATVSIRHDAMDAVEDTLRAHPFEEIILEHAPHRLARRFHVDLPQRLA